MLTFECLAKKRINKNLPSVIPIIAKEKTNIKLITEPAFLPNTCYVRLWVLKTDFMTINIDFDGTCVTHEFPNVGKSIGAEKVLKRLTDNGHQLILFTMRSDRTEAKPVIDPTIQNVTGKFLTDAVNWFKENNIPLYGIQKNPTQFNWTTSPKSYAELMIDDSALGCPLRYDLQVSERPFVDWEAVEEALENMKLLTK